MILGDEAVLLDEEIRHLILEREILYSVVIYKALSPTGTLQQCCCINHSWAGRIAKDKKW